MWTPRFLWIPAHRIQMNTPRCQEAHRGPGRREERREGRREERRGEKGGEERGERGRREGLKAGMSVDLKDEHAPSRRNLSSWLEGCILSMRLKWTGIHIQTETFCSSGPTDSYGGLGTIWRCCWFSPGSS